MHMATKIDRVHVKNQLQLSSRVLRKSIYSTLYILIFKYKKGQKCLQSPYLEEFVIYNMQQKL